MGRRSLNVMVLIDTAGRVGVHSVCETPPTFDVTKMLADALSEHLALTYQRSFDSREPRFTEVGFDRQLGYTGPVDRAERYPAFFWCKTEPDIADATRFLGLMVEGRRWIDQASGSWRSWARRRSASPPAR